MALARISALPRTGIRLKPRSETRSPVSVTENSIVFNPQEMELNKYYLAELKGSPYLYRRVSDGEVEVYGLAG